MILVVDDDPDIRQFVADRLAIDGYAVEQAMDGHEALQKLQVRQYDGIVLDIGMPDMDGLEVLRRIREVRATLPVVMMTAAERRDRALLAMQGGAQAFLLKPFDAGRFKEVVEEWFR
jgi:DNA-binding response OmpR family regulator